MINLKEPFEMDEKEVDDWLTALRSGEYNQGLGKLFSHSDFRRPIYCCLGVYGVAVKKIDNSELHNMCVFDESFLDIPEVLLCNDTADSRNTWAESLMSLNDSPLTYTKYTEFRKYNDNIKFPKLPKRNNFIKYNFNDIADFIEMNVTKIKKDEVK